jgi:CheY-like chemotaxis protein
MNEISLGHRFSLISTETVIMADRILIIDDEATLSAVLSIRLQATGFETVVANHGSAGIAAAGLLPVPDAIVLDVRMPDMDGFEVNLHLKSNPRTAQIPVIFLSANVQDSARRTAIAAGAYAYLKKPYDPTEVIQTLRDAIKARQPSR